MDYSASFKVDDFEEYESKEFPSIEKCLEFLNHKYIENRYKNKTFKWFIFDFNRSLTYGGCIEIKKNSSFIEEIKVK